MVHTWGGIKAFYLPVDHLISLLLIQKVCFNILNIQHFIINSLCFHLMRLFRHKLQAVWLNGLWNISGLAWKWWITAYSHHLWLKREVGFVRQRLLSPPNPNGNMPEVEEAKLYWVLLNVFLILVLLYSLSTSLLATAFCQRGDTSQLGFTEEDLNFRDH